jgi:hypothetical protein
MALKDVIDIATRSDLFLQTVEHYLFKKAIAVHKENYTNAEAHAKRLERAEQILGGVAPVRTYAKAVATNGTIFSKLADPENNPDYIGSEDFKDHIEYAACTEMFDAFCGVDNGIQGA